MHRRSRSASLGVNQTRAPREKTVITSRHSLPVALLATLCMYQAYFGPDGPGRRAIRHVDIRSRPRRGGRTDQQFGSSELAEPVERSEYRPHVRTALTSRRRVTHVPRLHRRVAQTAVQGANVITHYTMAAEIDRQRREQVAASIAAARRRRPRSRRAWWQFDVPHRSASPVPPDPTVLSGAATA
jgi:hypothetical protein